MKFQVIGCSHHDSSVDVRERLAFPENQIGQFLQSFGDHFPQAEAVLLSTCNRTEFYAAAKSEEQLPETSQMVRFLAEQRGLASSEIDAGLFSLEDQKAVEHLFLVAASLDSMVVGEAQILSQVKRAYQLASETNPTIPITHQVFQTAIRVARRVSNETEIHRTRVSVPSVAINVLAKQIFERLDDKEILVIGAGEMADETLHYIQADGGKQLTITNRTEEKANELANKWHGNTKRWDLLSEALVDADLVVSTTGATEPIVTKEMFDSVQRSRAGKPLLVLDLAVPRDFEANIADVDNVYLYSLDDLQRECEHNMESRKREFPKARKIVLQETENFLNEIRRRNSGSTIAQLRQQVDEIKKGELDRLWNRLEGIDPKHKSEIETSFHRLINKILHPPVKSVQSESKAGQGGLLEALKKLFQLGD